MLPVDAPLVELDRHAGRRLTETETGTRAFGLTRPCRGQLDIHLGMHDMPLPVLHGLLLHPVESSDQR